MINGIHHTAISVSDLDRAVKFYRDVLGFQVRTGDHWEVGTPEADTVVGLQNSAARFLMLWAGNTHIELFEYSSPTPTPRRPDTRVCDHGYTHICLDVSDIDAEYKRLAQIGMTFNGSPQSIMGVRTMYGRDPDHNVIEFQEVLDWPDLAMPAEALTLPKTLSSSGVGEPTSSSERTA